MTKIILITYDLKSPWQNYEWLYNAIKDGHTWWHYLESTWIIKTTATVDQLTDQLKPFLDTNDHIFIVDITSSSRQGRLPLKAWEWFK